MIVNVDEICEIEPLLAGDYRVTLRDHTQLTLSRRFRPALDRLLQRHGIDLPKSI
jgi:DNA-binding LytR/AlgR family response regulator